MERKQERKESMLQPRQTLVPGGDVEQSPRSGVAASSPSECAHAPNRNLQSPDNSNGVAPQSPPPNEQTDWISETPSCERDIGGECNPNPRNDKQLDEGSSKQRRWKSTCPKKWGRRNVYGLSIAFMAVFSAFIGLQNLQSSINADGGLGLASLAVLYSFFVLSGFITPCLVKLLGTKHSLLLGFCSHLVYTLANFYPSWFTLIPGSVLLGLASGPVWAASSTHISKVALQIAPKLSKRPDLLISRFIGVFFFIFQFSQIPGNLASSLILFPYSDKDGETGDSENAGTNSSTNDTSGALPTKMCSVLGSSEFDALYLYLLMSAYAVFIVTGIVILMTTVDQLQMDSENDSGDSRVHVYVRKPVLHLLRVLLDWKLVLLGPMALFSGLEMGFAFGTFTEVYIAECFGTYYIGFTLICLGVTSAVMSYAYSKLVKFIPYYSIVLLGSFLNAALIVTLLLWSVKPSYPLIFTFAVGWGAADAVWHTIPPALTGILFPNQLEYAYSALRIWQALGFTISFTSAEFISTETRLLVLLAAVLVAASSDLILEFRTQTRQQLLMCVYHHIDIKENSCPMKSVAVVKQFIEGEDSEGGLPQPNGSHGNSRRSSVQDTVVRTHEEHSAPSGSNKDDGDGGTTAVAGDNEITSP